MLGRRFALIVVLCLAFVGSISEPSVAAPYSSHAQIYACCTDATAMDSLFREAKESGAAYIRVDFELHGIAPDPNDPELRFWEGPDRIAALSRRYQLPVLAVLLGVSHGETTCPDAPLADQPLCPPKDPARWGRLAGEVAARYAGTVDRFEIWNEPDGAWAFRGTPADYAWMLANAYDSIKARAPAATVVLAGTRDPEAEGNAWLDRVFSTPGAQASKKFDIGSIHLRGPLDAMLAALSARRALWVKWGRQVPTWVTEHGYSADPAYQAGSPPPLGEAVQAANLASSLPALGLAGADQIFVTLRDLGAREFASEGILGGQGSPGDPFRRKPAWQAVLDATRAWPMVLALASRPQPVAFERGFLVSSTKARQTSRIRAASAGRGKRARILAWSRRPLTRFRIDVSGRFAGRGCTGQVQFTYRLSHVRRTVRAAPIDRGCRYRAPVELRLPTTVKLPARLQIDQQFLGNETTRPGRSETLSLRLEPLEQKEKPRRRVVSRPRPAP